MKKEHKKEHKKENEVEYVLTATGPPEAFLTYEWDTETILFKAAHNNLKIKPDGFYVNDKLTINDMEIYVEFKSWLASAGININQ